MKVQSAAISLLLLILFLMPGCIPSIHPLYTDDKLVFVDDLIGIWEDDESGTSGDSEKFKVTFKKDSTDLPETWIFEKSHGKSYKLIQRDRGGRVAAFEVHLVELGAYLFIDFFPTEYLFEDGKYYSWFKNQKELNDFQTFHLLPVHTFAKLELTDTELTIRMFDPDFLEKLFEQKRVRIKHEEEDGGYVLTAAPKDLQKFVLKYAEVEEAFIEPTVLKRNH